VKFSEILKSQLDIVRTVGEYVRLRKAGSRWVGLCPFHTEKSPSFGVNPSLGIYICFGCGKKGDVIHFIQEIEQLTFVEAMKLLAERNGIPMPERRERNDPDSELRDAIYLIHEQATRAFQENLFGSNGTEARQYLAQRGLNKPEAELFELGFSDRTGQDLLRRLRQSFSPAQLEASGLFGKREDGSLYDRFRGRLMFPIHNESGKVIAFGGRTLRADEEPKYLNSPETSIYKKKAVLYNLHRAKDSMRKGDRAILVEGYMDVIGVYAAGVHQVVASCGTSLTPEQIRSMKRHSENVVVNFDPDNAGASAAERSIELLLDEHLHVRVLELDGGLDPDAYIRTNGAPAYVSRLEKASGYFIWLADRARKRFDMSTAEGRMEGFQTLLLPAMRHLTDRLEQATVAAEVAGYLGIDQQLVRNEFKRNLNQGRDHRTGAPPPEANPLPHSQRVLLRSLVIDATVRDMLLPHLQASQAARRYEIWPIIEAIADLSESGEEISFTVIEARLEDRPRELLAKVLFADSSEEVFSFEQALAYVDVLASDEQKLATEELRVRLKEAERIGNTEEAFRIMDRLSNVQKRAKP
jgi:DNA primase